MYYTLSITTFYGLDLLDAVTYWIEFLSFHVETNCLWDILDIYFFFLCNFLRL